MSIASRFESSISLDQNYFGNHQKYRDLTKRVTSPRTSLWVNLAMLVIAITGLSISSYLSWVAITSSKIGGCSGGAVFDCNHVMGTKWSNVLGVPVAIPAMIIYLAISTAIGLKLSSSNLTIHKSATNVVAFGALAAALAATWFVSLQFFVVEHLCSYCLAAHACGITLAAIVLFTQNIPKRIVVLATTMALAGVVTLATVQILSEAPKTYEIQTFDTPAVMIGSDDDASDVSNVFEPPIFEAPIVEAPIVEAPIVEAPKVAAPNIDLRETSVNSIVSQTYQTANRDVGDNQ